MLDISGSPDHLTETGVATSTTAPIKVAPIKSIFRIVVLLKQGCAPVWAGDYSKSV
jgi:hypothetical protein